MFSRCVKRGNDQELSNGVRVERENPKFKKSLFASTVAWTRKAKKKKSTVTWPILHALHGLFREMVRANWAVF